MNLNDPAELDRIQAVCDGATVGPWTNEGVMHDAYQTDICAPSTPETGNPNMIATMIFGSDYEPLEGAAQALRDAEFIALARTALPLAIAALRERAWKPICEDYPMTHKQIAAVLTGIRDDEFFDKIEADTDARKAFLQERVGALNSAIAHYTTLDATGEEAKEHAKALHTLWASEARLPISHVDYESLRAMEVGAAAITALAASEAKVRALTEALKNIKDAAEMLWTVLANVSGGDWEKQSSEWQGAAARWRDNYFAALKEAGHE